jgi:sugar phosphate isomerase/epimerase
MSALAGKMANLNKVITGPHDSSAQKAGGFASPVSRREFLRRAAGGAAAAGLAASGRISLLAAADGPHLEFPTEPRSRLAVASYPFRRLMDSPFNRKRDPQHPGMDLVAFARMVVERYNVAGIEPMDHHFASRDPKDLEALREAFQKAGVHVVNIPVEFRQSFYDPDANQRKAAIDAAKQWVNAAVLVGSPSIRVHVAGVHGAAPDATLAAESLKELADYGGEHNIIVTLENDDLVSEDAFFIVRVLDRVNHPYLRALPDFGNSAMTGDPAFNLDALTLMFRHAYNISHMKDSEEGDGGKIYNADVPGTFRIARECGYRGYFSMEMDRSGDPYEGTARLIEHSLEALKSELSARWRQHENTASSAAGS